MAKDLDFAGTTTATLFSQVEFLLKAFLEMS